MEEEEIDWKSGDGPCCSLAASSMVHPHRHELLAEMQVVSGGWRDADVVALHEEERIKGRWRGARRGSWRRRCRTRNGEAATLDMGPGGGGAG